MWKVWVSLALTNTITTQQPNATFRVTFKLVHKQRSLWHYYRTSCWTWKCRALASFESQAIVYNEQSGQQSSENLKVFTNLFENVWQSCWRFWKLKSGRGMVSMEVCVHLSQVYTSHRFLTALLANLTIWILNHFVRRLGTQLWGLAVNGYNTHAQFRRLCHSGWHWEI